jgi:uncharacterized protein YegP (UPF0339 family)
MKFTTYQDARHEYRWRITSSNGRIVADSGEGYVRKSVAVASVRRLVAAIQALPVSVEVGTEGKK